MKKMKDPATGTTLYVQDDKVAKFKAAGYKEATGRPVTKKKAVVEEEKSE